MATYGGNVDDELDTTTTSKPATQFPSWSWLPVLGADGNTNTHGWHRDQVDAERYATELKVLSVETTWHGLPFTSELKSTKLEVSGSVIHALIGEPVQTGYPSKISCFALRPLEKEETAHPSWSPSRCMETERPTEVKASQVVTLLHLYQEPFQIPYPVSTEPDKRYQGSDMCLCLTQPPK